MADSETDGYDAVTEGDQDDDLSESSDSDSESDYPAGECGGTDGDNQVLTLDDDGPSLLVHPGEGDVELDGEEPGEDGDDQITYEEEGEGEGDGEELEKEAVSTATETPEPQRSEKKKKKKKKKRLLYICLANCKYDVVRRVSKKFGFKETSEDEDWTLYWTDYSVALERVMDMKKYQKINHFPGMNEVCRKDLLARNLNRMLKMFPKEYNVFPKTWCLPADHGDFLAYTRQKKNKTYILKPESGCQGRGIWVTRNPKEIKANEHMICQVYMNKPFLIDGFKFDLRIYTLVTSCDPLRIFVFKDGLARFATTKYCEPNNNNTDNVYMHLTNYAINKHSEDFIRDDEAAGSKRRISTINRYLREKGYDVDKLWADIDDVIIKTLISAHSVLRHNYRTCFPNHVKGSACFEILGLDIILDKKMRPYVLEVNHSPSFTTDADIDKEIKGTLVWDTLNLVNFGGVDRRKCIEEEKRRIKDRLLGKCTKKETKEELEQAQLQYLEQLEKYENEHLGNFRRIYPGPGTEKYEKYFHSSGTLFQETASFRARTELARQQREEIMRKKEKMEAMIKGKRSSSNSLRPESPTSRRRRQLRRNLMQGRKLNTSRTSLEQLLNEARAGLVEEPVDTSKPMDILEEEELERISGLLQRDNLVRGLGIVEHVYRLLHFSPGAGKTEPRPLPPPIEVSGTQCPVGHVIGAPNNFQGRKPVHVKDRLYYKRLMDRYFGSDHALSKDVSLRYLRQREEERRQASSSLCSLAGIAGAIPGETVQLYPHVRLTHSSNQPDARIPFTVKQGGQSGRMTDEPCGEPGYGSRWQDKNGSLGNLNERTLPSYQRTKLTRKPTLVSGVRGAQAVMPDPQDYRALSNLTETEAERNRLLARAGHGVDWRSDNATPTQRPPQGRIFSASGQRRETVERIEAVLPTRMAASSLPPGWTGRQDGDLPVPRYTNHTSSGLSVVSAPAPVVQRPDLSPSHPGFSRMRSHQSLSDGPSSQRSTKSQRVRGASNNIRLRQIEMRENHAFVFS